jgi:hypothetical protein
MTGFNLPKKRLDKVNGPCSLVEENTEWWGTWWKLRCVTLLGLP